MKKIKWKKPNEKIIETNDTDASINTAIDLGWELVEEKKPKKKAQKTKE